MYMIFKWTYIREILVWPYISGFVSGYYESNLRAIPNVIELDSGRKVNAINKQRIYDEYHWTWMCWCGSADMRANICLTLAQIWRIEDKLYRKLEGTYSKMQFHMWVNLSNEYTHSYICGSRVSIQVYQTNYFFLN